MLNESGYISFQKASEILAKRLSATKSEIAMWAWLGELSNRQSLDGLAAFANHAPSTCCRADYCHEFDPSRCAALPPPRLHTPNYDVASKNDDVWLWLSGAYFLETTIDEFDPIRAGRFISWCDLLVRWRARGLSEGEVLEKVRQRIVGDGELTDMNPIFGRTEISGANGVPKESAMFELEKIQAIEERDFPIDGEISAVEGSPIVVAGDTAVYAQIVRIKRAALITRYQREWPAIEDDLRHSNENGLRDAAKLPNQHGYWNEAAVVRWAEERGKLLMKQKPESPRLDPMTAWVLRKQS